MTKRVREFETVLRGKRVSHTWRGYGSVIFLEFGKLFPTRTLKGQPGQPQGELSLMSGWEWRVERRQSLRCASWLPERHWPRVLKQLVGSKVQRIQFSRRMPEVKVSLSNGLRVISAMATDGPSSWAVISHTPMRRSLGVKGRTLHVENHGS